MTLKLYTAAEAAQILGLHIETIRRAIRSGELRAARWKRRAGYRISPGDLEAYYQSKGGGRLFAGNEYARPSDEPQSSKDS